MQSCENSIQQRTSNTFATYSNLMKVDTICICGAGTMGCGIAQVAAASGLQTILYELNGEVLEKAKKKIEKNLQTWIDKNKIGTGEKEKTYQRIQFTNNITDCQANVFIEAIVEKLEVKVRN